MYIETVKIFSASIHFADNTKVFKQSTIVYINKSKYSETIFNTQYMFYTTIHTVHQFSIKYTFAIDIS